MRRERQEATASAQRSHRMRHSLGAALGCLLCVGILQVAAQQPSGGTPTAGPGLTVISGTLPSASGGGPGLPSAMGGVPAGSASTLPVLTPLMIGPDGSLTPVAIQPGASQPPAGTPPAGGGQPAGTMGPPTGALPQPR
ncbi:MAG: hypothetical protein RMJ88_16900, partial [Thermogemmata sp.]|nr:hypothetical protein [Thermogemmata sp.]